MREIKSRENRLRTSEVKRCNDKDLLFMVRAGSSRRLSHKFAFLLRLTTAQQTMHDAVYCFTPSCISVYALCIKVCINLVNVLRKSSSRLSCIYLSISPKKKKKNYRMIFSVEQESWKRRSFFASLVKLKKKEKKFHEIYIFSYSFRKRMLKELFQCCCCCCCCCAMLEICWWVCKLHMFFDSSSPLEGIQRQQQQWHQK